MTEGYINKGKLIEDIRRAASRSIVGEIDEPYLDWRTVVSFIFDAPVEEVEPVRHGKWIWINQATGYLEPPYGDTCKCSECGFIIDVSEAHFKHCPECCAKMIKE